MSVRVHSLRQVSCSGPARRPAAWFAALFAAASLLFAAAPQAAAQTNSLPGTIQAEDFDAGASGTAYKDMSSGNAGGKYRSTDVDIETSAEGGYNVGWTAAGEWLNYTVNVAAAGTYNLDVRVASAAGGSFYIHFNGVNETGTITVPATGGWQKWTTVRKSVSLAAGPQSMRVSLNGGVNLNAFTVSSSTSTASTAATASSSAFGGTAHAIPGWVQAEDFDNGGKNVAYYDASSGNSGGAYRATDVDISKTSSGGYAVGWIGAGEWLKYTMNVAATGNYKVVARVASAGTGGKFHIEFNGANKTGTMSVPNTGGWQTYQDLTATVSLSAGVQSMRIVFDSIGSTGAVGNLSAVRFDATSGTTAPAPAPTPTPEPDPAPAPSGTGGALRVLTWNIHFGAKGTSAQAQLLANSGAHVIALQEASTYDENMPVTYRDRLKTLTGKTWYSVWAPHLRSAAASEGTLILSRYPIVNSSAGWFEDRGFARALIDVGGVRVQVFAVHLEYSDRAKRTRQLSAFMAWAKTFAGPRLALGDFNSWWGESWIQTMETQYSDTWEMVSGSVQNGYTLNGSVRFDYIFRSFTDESRVGPTKCWTASSGGLSDHAPLLADFTVR